MKNLIRISLPVGAGILLTVVVLVICVRSYEKQQVNKSTASQTIALLTVLPDQWVGRNIPQDYSFSGTYAGEDDPKIAVRKNGWKVIETTGQKLHSIVLGPDTQEVEYKSLENRPLVISFSTGPNKVR